MTTPPTLRDRAIDAAKQAINALGMWLPPAGREAAVDAVLALTAPEACCVCGGGPVAYRNYREQPFCQPCADCQCGEQPCVRTGVNDPAVSAETALALLHKGEEEPTTPRLSGPTPAEWLWHWNRATPAQRLEQAAQIIDAGMRAGTCFQMAHEKTIQRLHAELGRPTV